MPYLTLNNEMTELTISDSDDLSDYDTQRLFLDIDDVTKLIADLVRIKKTMRVDVKKQEINELLKQREVIEARLKVLGA